MRDPNSRVACYGWARGRGCARAGLLHLLWELIRPLAASLACRRCPRHRASGVRLSFHLDVLLALRRRRSWRASLLVGPLSWKSRRLLRASRLHRSVRAALGREGARTLRVHFVVCRCPAGWHETADAVCDEFFVESRAAELCFRMRCAAPPTYTGFCKRSLPLADIAGERQVFLRAPQWVCQLAPQQCKNAMLSWLAMCAGHASSDERFERIQDCQLQSVGRRAASYNVHQLWRLTLLAAFRAHSGSD